MLFFELTVLGLPAKIIYYKEINSLLWVEQF